MLWGGVDGVGWSGWRSTYFRSTSDTTPSSTNYLLLTTHYSLPTTYYLLLTTYHLLLTTYHLLLTTYYLLLTAYYSLGLGYRYIQGDLRITFRVDQSVLWLQVAIRNRMAAGKEKG